MRNNKGFVLMETIIVMSVLSLALMTLYSSYVKIMSNSKAKNYYDTPEALYIADAVKQAYIYNEAYLKSTVTGSDTADKKATITKNGNSYKITCYPSLATMNPKTVCNAITNKMAYQLEAIKKMYQAFNIEAVYIVKASEFKNATNINTVIQFFDGSTIGYLKSIDRSTINKMDDINTDLIIVKIKTEDGYIFGRSEREVAA